MKIIINVQVDDKKVTLEQNILTGEAIKQASGIPKEVTLVLDGENEPAKEILNEETYTIKSGMDFFSSLYKKEVIIEIDNKEYTIENPVICGADLIRLAQIDTSTHKLVKEAKHGADMIIDENTAYYLEKKDVFFSIIRGIQNGVGGKH